MKGRSDCDSENNSELDSEIESPIELQAELGYFDEYALEKITRRDDRSITPAERQAMEANGTLDEDWRFLTLPLPGEGHNDGLPRLARLLTKIFGLSREEAFDHMRGEYDPDRPDSDIHRALDLVGLPSTGKTGKKFPPADPRLTAAAIAATGFDMEDLCFFSIADTQTPAEEVLRVLMRAAPGDDALVCIGESAKRFRTAPLSKWGKLLRKLPYFVPQPMVAREGMTKGSNPHLSPRTDANTSRDRINLVVEFDHLDKDSQAACILLLAGFAPLIVVCESGRKSLHAFFNVAGRPLHEQMAFMAVACQLGADPRLWTRSQFARIPGGRRPAVAASASSPKRPAAAQPILYFRPSSTARTDLWRINELVQWAADHSETPSINNLADGPDLQNGGDFTAGSGIEQLLEKLAARKFDFAEIPEKPAAVLKLDGVTLSTPGNLTNIQAPPKAGKSAAIAAALAGILRGDNNGGDCLGFSSDNPECKAVIHFDTEQSRYDHHALVRRILWRAGIKGPPPPWFLSYSLADLDIHERRKALRAIMATAAREFGGILAVCIDGVGDLCNALNDEAEAGGLVAELHKAAIFYDRAVLTVLHENPGSEQGKTRGHLGSQLERKAETNLRLSKDGAGVTTIFTEKSRHCHIPKSQGVCFRWDVTEGTHVSCGAAAEVRSDAKRSAMEKEAGQVLNEGENYSHGDLAKMVSTKFELKDRAARTRIENWLKGGIVSKDGLGKYRLSPEEL